MKKQLSQRANKAVKRLFENSNFTTKTDIQIKGLTQAQFMEFTEFHGLQVSYDQLRGIVMLWRDGNPLSNEQINSL